MRLFSQRPRIAVARTNDSNFLGLLGNLGREASCMADDGRKRAGDLAGVGCAA